MGTERQKPTENEMMRIALDCFLSLSTVRKVYKGGGHRNSRNIVSKSAKKLGVSLPEKSEK